MLNYIWFGLIFISVVVGTITGRIDQVTEAAISMSKTAVEIAIGLIGIMALWLGIMKIAEDSGACAVMALERIPSDIRKDGGIARMSDPKMIEEIQNSGSIPVMAKCRIGHFAEAQVLEALEVDFIDESEVLTLSLIHI